MLCSPLCFSCSSVFPWRRLSGFKIGKLERLIYGGWWWYEEEIDSYGIWIWKCLYEVDCLITSLKNRYKNCLIPLDPCVVLILSRMETQGTLRDMVSAFIRIQLWLTFLELRLMVWKRVIRLSQCFMPQLEVDKQNQSKIIYWPRHNNI